MSNQSEANKEGGILNRPIISRRGFLKLGAASAGILGADYVLSKVGGKEVLLPKKVEAADIRTRFDQTWEETDGPVVRGEVSRTWIWGPVIREEMQPYAEAPGGQRLVRICEKSRMEDNSYRASPPWDVTNGLLVIELMTGKRQVGDNSFQDLAPANNIPVAGDPINPNAQPMLI